MLLVVGTSLVIVLVLGAVLVLTSRRGSTPADAASESAPYDPSPLLGQLSFTVDASLQPVVNEVDGMFDGDAPRPVARLQDTDGRVSDLVLDEVLVSAADRATVDAFAARWNGSIVDVIGTSEPNQTNDYLVRADPPAPTSHVAPTCWSPSSHTNRARCASVRTGPCDSSPSPRSRQAITTWPCSRTGSVREASIEDGSSIEAYDIGNRNAFDWSYVRSGGEQDIGVGPAWQLLSGEGKLRRNSVRIMINDGGFNDNPDFPAVKVLRKAQWGELNGMRCTGGALCPWHGSEVTMTAMGGSTTSTAWPVRPVPWPSWSPCRRRRTRTSD